MRNRLLYVAHTSPAVREQALYSILSALAHRGDLEVAIHVYTDLPGAFEGVAGRVELTPVSADLVARWALPAGYRHRVKPAAMRDLASRHPDDKLLFADADTFFTGPLSTLFGRIGPRAAVMHEREYNVARSDLAVMHRFRRRMARATFRGAPAELGWDMWNSGVVGLHPALFPLIDDWLAYLDEVFPQAKRWVLEQYALASLLQRGGVAIAEAADVVVHYWFDKDGYSPEIHAAVERARALPLDGKIALVGANAIARPRRAATYGKPANFFQRVFGW